MIIYEALLAFPLKLGKSQGWLLLTLSTLYGKEAKIWLFADAVIVYLETPREYIDNLLETTCLAI